MKLGIMELKTNTMSCTEEQFFEQNVGVVIVLSVAEKKVPT